MIHVKTFFKVVRYDYEWIFRPTGVKIVKLTALLLFPGTIFAAGTAAAAILRCLSQQHFSTRTTRYLISVLSHKISIVIIAIDRFHHHHAPIRFTFPALTPTLSTAVKSISPREQQHSASTYKTRMNGTHAQRNSTFHVKTVQALVHHVLLNLERPEFKAAQVHGQGVENEKPVFHAWAAKHTAAEFEV
jgi:hypothetical protein